MQSSLDAQGYDLPTVINPPDTVCFQVSLPNDPGYIKAFLGALYDTTVWNSWQRDDAHKGIQAARVMKEIWYEVVNGLTPCSSGGGANHIYEDMSDMPPFRLDCDCNLYVTCCNGDEKQILTRDQVIALIQSQPGQGAQQPSPGGGQACYTGSVPGNSQFLIPTPVSTGDVLTLQSAKGATQDGTFAGYWRLPDGGILFAGNNIGGGVTESGDPLNSVYHMRLIWDIGGVYYDAMSGPLTVPSGVSSVQPVLMVNDSALGDNSGGIDVVVCVTNNAAGVWTSTFDFTTNVYSAIWTLLHGSWVSGQGIVGTTNGSEPYVSQIDVAGLSITLESMEILYTASAFGGTAENIYLWATPTYYAQTFTPATGIGVTYSHTEERTGVNELTVAINTGAAGSQCYLARVVVHGKGTRPAGWPTS